MLHVAASSPSAGVSLAPQDPLVGSDSAETSTMSLSPAKKRGV